MDSQAPGSFPVDDVMSSNTTGPNKLHKAGDPRGDPAFGKTSAHSHTDSGVGLTEAGSPQSTRGVGVYNTVAGHGSQEDDTIRQARGDTFGEQLPVEQDTSKTGLGATAVGTTDAPVTRGEVVGGATFTGDSQGQRKTGDGQYDHLSSGTPSGVRKAADDTYTSTSSTSQPSKEQPSSHDMAKIAALTAVGGAGAGAGTMAYEENRKRDEQTAYQASNVAAAAPLTDTTATKDPEPYKAPETTTATTTTTTTTSAYDDLRRDDKSKYEPIAASETAPRTDTTFDDSQPSRGTETAAALGTGAAAAGGVAALSSTSERQGTDTSAGALGTDRTTDTSAGGLGAERTTEPVDHEPTKLANEGQYKTLASGTPSGVKIDADDDMTSSSVKKPDSKALDNVAPDAGTAVFASEGPKTTAPITQAEQDPLTQQKDDPLTKQKEADPITEQKDEDPITKQEEEKPTAAEAAPLAAAAAATTAAPSSKVIHKCTECGADNDISHYFNKS